MTMLEAIGKRKSVRKFKNQPLSPEILQEIQDYMHTVSPLFPDIKTEFRIMRAGEAKGIFSIEAPHYLAFYSEDKKGHLMNAGFMLQQLDLYLVTRGFGSCWLGLAKPTKKQNTELDFIIVKAFGDPLDSPTRETAEFKRKPLEDISTGEDSRLAYARIAPSATNAQPWFFVKEQTSIAVYRQHLGAIKENLLGWMNQVDIGIALCHVAIASVAEGVAFNFKMDAAPQTPPLLGYTYMGSIGTE